MKLAPDGVLLFRVDGSERTGLGHVSRCSALSEGLAASGVRAVFAGEYVPAAQAIIARSGGRSVPPPSDAELAPLAAAYGARAIVVDGYEFEADLFERAAPAATGRPLVIIDDLARLSRYPDRALIVNFTIRASELEYRGSRLKILRGPQYLLVGGAISELATRGKQNQLSSGRRVLISLGTGEWVRLALRISQVIKKVAPDTEVRLVGGAQGSLEVAHRDVDVLPEAPTLAAHFDWADTCVSGGGLTKYEACYLGIPTAVVPRTPEEEWDTAGFRSRGLVLELGNAASDEALAAGLRALIADSRQRRALAEACARTFRPASTNAASVTILDQIDRFWKGVRVGSRRSVG